MEEYQLTLMCIFIYYYYDSKNNYRKNSKNWDTIMITVIVVKVERYGFTLPESIQKGGDGISNSLDPDQTAPSGEVCSGSALFAQTYLSQYLELLR